MYFVCYKNVMYCLVCHQKKGGGDQIHHLFDIFIHHGPSSSHKFVSVFPFSPLLCLESFFPHPQKMHLFINSMCYGAFFHFRTVCI